MTPNLASLDSCIRARSICRVRVPRLLSVDFMQIPAQAALRSSRDFTCWWTAPSLFARTSKGCVSTMSDIDEGQVNWSPDRGVGGTDFPNPRPAHFQTFGLAHLRIRGTSAGQFSGRRLLSFRALTLPGPGFDSRRLHHFAGLQANQASTQIRFGFAMLQEGFELSESTFQTATGSWPGL
jgi:hypothetical protein